MRRIVFSSTVIGVSGFLAWAAIAQPNFDARPTLSDQGSVLLVSGTLTGLPPGEVAVRVRATGTATVACLNPGGATPAGQNRSRQRGVTVRGEQIVPVDAGGRTVFGVTTNDVTFNSPRRAGCPNDNWTAEVRDVRFRTVTVAVFHNGQVLLRQNMTM